jgi:hypothetical protein
MNSPKTDSELLVFIIDDTLISETSQASTVSGARDGRDVGASFSKRVDAVTGAISKRVSLPTSKLKQQIGSLIGVLSEVFDQAEQKENARISLDEIELTVEITTEGQLGILGSGGKAGGKGGITLKFKRN